MNLLSLINAKNSLSTSVFELYLRKFNIKKPKANELKDLESLVNQLVVNSAQIIILDQFYIGYIIEQISKEFDLLRFGEESIINIELKSKSTGERIKRQLVKNRYYLSFLEKEIFSFTYIAEDKKLFYLSENNNLIETDFSFLISKLNNQELSEIENVDKLFNPSNYLVSPFNSTEAFMKGQYFLTDHQINIKKSILKLGIETGACFITIEGSAGTGKTLLTYDIAKEYRNNLKNVLIFHCGSLNDGHNKLKDEYSWEIASVKNFEFYNLKNYDLVIIDEVQRIYKNQLDSILNNIKKTNATCILSYDSKQCLARWEIENNIPQYIKEQVSPRHFKLTDKIRTNKEIASFIKNLFDLSKINPTIKYSNIDIQYFSNSTNAREYIGILSQQSWKVINYTPSMYELYPYDRYQNRENDSAHKVIGQEYDKVVAVIDEHFYYRKDEYLSTKGWSSQPYYHPTRMLFQILTRTRKKLSIIIINNEPILNQCMKILGINDL
ncbi:TPA: ATP-binding protein [Clostridium botulinum]|uniref:ATP-binding protein n=2 Tax=Clostridium botulinum TaxID=1491 RepID=UPI0009B0DA6C|nr:ATP-binding protein [Clostridium botulinum]MBN3350521.1 hypothetical protein [Clostridium botulinum]MBN3357557.1 hypothetical protein [Clostridium botulinum]MBN3361710.1 hypothetical protein [Clostridium botulinum]NFP13269.1 ATP-binding protein [Clostridium botulinum]NFR30463.1 ATP-binding protein [Clostridium botulinum]